MPSSTSGPTFMRAWPNRITSSPPKATKDPMIEREPTSSFKKIAESRSAASGAMKVRAIAYASGTRPMPQKKRKARAVTMTPRMTWIFSVRRLGQRFCRGR